MKKFIKWRDIQINDKLEDGSVVTDIHKSYDAECYTISYRNNLHMVKCVVSDTHAILCDIQYTSQAFKDMVSKSFDNYGIPMQITRHIFTTPDGQPAFRYDHAVTYEPSHVQENLYWLNAKFIYYALKHFPHERVYCNNHLIRVQKNGTKRVFCIETDTHHYQTQGLIHHNSVTLRNIILHCLTHSDETALVLVDIKIVEFESYKGFKNVVAVANTLEETVEVCRIVREVMYKRNAQLATQKVADYKDYKPQKPTDFFSVCGHRMHKDEQLEVELENGEHKTLSVEDTYNLLHETDVPHEKNE